MLHFPATFLLVILYGDCGELFFQGYDLVIIVDKRTASCTIEYVKVLIDSDALIKLTRAGMKELLVNAFIVRIPQTVADETASEDMCAQYPDAVAIQDNLEKELLHVVNLPPIFSS
jgi:hypothetical protein